MEAPGHLPQSVDQLSSDRVVDLKKAHTIELVIENFPSGAGSPWLTFKLLDSLPGGTEPLSAQAYAAPGTDHSRLLVDLPQPGRYEVSGLLWQSDPKSLGRVLTGGSYGTVEVPAGKGVALTFDVNDPVR